MEALQQIVTIHLKLVQKEQPAFYFELNSN